MSDLTIGIPVYNGQDQIADALENLLQQSSGDFEVLVSDNASTDKTADIVTSFAERDARITLVRQPQNLGPVGNFRWLAEAAKTEFFAWRAHDDITDLHFFKVLRQQMKAYPEISLMVPKTITSKKKGDRERPFQVPLKITESANWRHLSHVEAGWMYGLFRTPTAQRGAAFAHNHYRHVWGWDYLVILCALLEGGVRGTNEAQFIHRLHGPAVRRYDFSKAQLRSIFADFYRAGEKMAEEAKLQGLARQHYRFKLASLIARRVVRWQRLLF